MVGLDGISRRNALIAVGIGVVVVAGVLLLTGGASGSGALEQVPAGVDTIVRLDLTITGDRLKQFEAVINGAPLPLGGSGNATDPAAVFDNRTGIDSDKATELVVFSDNRTANESDYGGYILHTNAETDAAVDGIQNTTNTSYQSTTYNGRTVYAPENETYRYIGVLGDGEIVVGTQAAVRDTIDVSEGDAESLSGGVLTAYEDTRNGTVQFATSEPARWVPADAPLIDTEPYRNVDTVAGTYYIEDGSAGLTVQLQGSSTDNAKSVRSVTRGAVAIGQNTVENESAVAALESINVTRDGTTVTVRYEQEIEAFQDTLRYLYAEQLG